MFSIGFINGLPLSDARSNRAATAIVREDSFIFLPNYQIYLFKTSSRAGEVIGFVTQSVRVTDS